MKLAKRKETPHAALAECGEDVIVRPVWRAI